MSRKQVTIHSAVMQQIHEEHIQMRPRIYFVLGSLLLFVSLVLSLLSTVFLFSLTDFILRSHGPMGHYRWEQLLSSFPWWAPLLALVGVVVSIWLLKKYDFSYKRNFIFIVMGVIVAIFLASWMIDYFHFDNVWFQRGPMHGMMREYLQNSPSPFQMRRSLP